MNLQLAISVCTIALLFVNVSRVQMKNINDTFFPNLSIGEFRMDIKGIYRCNVADTNKIQFNLYLNKTSWTTSVMKGNFTNLMPFDDTLFINYNFDVRDSIGGWKDNALMLTKAKACTTLLSFINESYLSDFGLRSTCPMPAGVRVMPGVDTSHFEKRLLNMPKMFSYGTYKLRVSVTNKNKEIYGCTTLLLEIKKPWETYQ